MGYPPGRGISRDRRRGAGGQGPCWTYPPTRWGWRGARCPVLVARGWAGGCVGGCWVVVTSCVMVCRGRLVVAGCLVRGCSVGGLAGGWSGLRRGAGGWRPAGRGRWSRSAGRRPAGCSRWAGGRASRVGCVVRCRLGVLGRVVGSWRCRVRRWMASGCGVVVGVCGDVEQGGFGELQEAEGFGEAGCACACAVVGLGGDPFAVVAECWGDGDSCGDDVHVVPRGGWGTAGGAGGGGGSGGGGGVPRGWGVVAGMSGWVGAA